MTLRRLIVALLLIVAWVMGIAASAEAQDCHGRGLLLTCGAQPGPTLDLNFLSGTLDSRVSFSRASGATSALYTDAAGASFTTYSNNQPRLMSQGLLIEEQRTNYLLNSGAPVTQTTGSLSTGSYVFFCNGTGSVTSSAGTATATGLGAQSCSAGTYQSISVSVAGALTFTVSGAVGWFDLQGGSFPTSHIVTAGTTATRSADVATVAGAQFGPSASSGTLVIEVQTAAGVPGPGVWAQIDDGTGSNRYDIEQSSSTVYQTRAVVGGVVKANPQGTFTGGSVVKAAIGYALNDFVGYGNGAQLGMFALNPLPNVTSLSIGNTGGTFQPNARLRRIRYWPRRVSNAQLQQLTQ